jgi:O-antigen ligase
LVVLSLTQIYKGKKVYTAVLIPLIIILAFMINDGDIKMSQLEKTTIETVSHEKITYREYARHKALEVWKDHPVWGVGPGMFGGAVATKYISPMYEEYNFTVILRKIKSLDQLWPQILAETGVIGAALVTGLFSMLFVLFETMRRQTAANDVRGLMSGLSVFTIILIIYTLSGNLNNASLFFPYFAFAGIAFGCYRK